ncbi:MAG: HAMP domain-containing histidine kinase [Spirochaetales bacterium]|nr:HAMP domain-containing histidine kinase [Spirochaetales bacterium]
MSSHQQKSSFELLRLGFLIAGASTLVFLPMEFYLKPPSWPVFTSINILLTVLYFGFWRLVRPEWLTKASIALCTASSFQMFLAVNFHYGPLLGLQAFFLIFAYLPFLLLPTHHRAWVYTLSSLNIVFFVWTTFFLSATNFTTYSADVMRFSHLMSALIIVAIFIVLVIYFQICSRRREAELLDNAHNQDLLFSLIAHDLRGPVGGLKEGLGFYEFHRNAMGDQEQADFLHSLRQTADNTFTLLENLLLWTSQRQGRLPFHPFPHAWKDLVDSVVGLWQEQARGTDVTFERDIPNDLIVTCDADMMSTVLRNLISNAVKFSPKKSVIQIRSSLSNGWFCCEVQDSGMGMDANTQAALFNTKDRPQRHGLRGERGTGLGLLLVQEFVAHHGGKVSVQSVLGKGSTFRVELPQIPQ